MTRPEIVEEIEKRLNKIEERLKRIESQYEKGFYDGKIEGLDEAKKVMEAELNAPNTQRSMF